MTTIIDYMIIEEADVSDLQRQVKDKIKQGWQPFGSLQVAAPVLHGGKVLPCFIQPVVIYGTLET